MFVEGLPGPWVVFLRVLEEMVWMRAVELPDVDGPDAEKIK